MSFVSLRYPLGSLFGVVGYFTSLVTSITLTPDNPSTSFASISLISDDDNEEIDNVYRCNIINDFGNTGETSDFCVELNINKDCISGNQQVQIEVNLARDADDVDIIALFAYESSPGEYSYFSYLTAYDGKVNNGASGSNNPATFEAGGVFIAPYCNSGDLLTYSGNNIGDNFLDSIGTNPNAPKIRAAIADGDSNNYQRLTETGINDDGLNPSIRYTFIENYYEGRIETSFETAETGKVSCDIDTTYYVNTGASDSYTILFGADDGIIEFESFEVTTTCQDENVLYYGGCDCDSVSVQCKVSGDPHFNTFDGRRHHFQGGGIDGIYYDYVTDCAGSTPLPFKISALQKTCNGIYTCVKEVVVTLKDESGNILGYIYYPSNGGIPTDQNGNDARGSQSFSFFGETGSYTVSNKNFEIEFGTYDNNGNQVNARLSFGYSGTSLNIRACECLLNLLCGLCGTYNNDGFDEFTRCDNGNVIDNTGTSSFRGMTNEQWENTLDFGDSCCTQDTNLNANGICPETLSSDVPLPDTTCTNNALNICEELYDSDDNCNKCEINGGLDYYEFLDDCVVDICDVVDNDLNGCEGLDCADTTWIETSQDACNVQCDGDGILGTVAPSEEPTAEPLPLP